MISTKRNNKTSAPHIQVHLKFILTDIITAESNVINAVNHIIKAVAKSYSLEKKNKDNKEMALAKKMTFVLWSFTK